MIEYRSGTEGVEAAQLAGFFEGWPNPPSKETHLRLLRGSSHAVLAVEGARVVGFVTAVSDGVLNAYLPLLEVLPTHRGRGIGGELVRRVLEEIGPLYSISLHCDADLEPFYAPLGFRPLGGMAVRNYDAQSGAR